MAETPQYSSPVGDLEAVKPEAPSIESIMTELVALPAAPGPWARVGRTAVQVLLAVLGAIPLAWAALTAAGVEVDPGVTALVLGIPAALVILISAGWNVLDDRRGLG